MKLVLIHSKQFVIVLILQLMMVFAMQAQTVEELIEKGNAAYKARSFIAAQRWYEEAIAKDLEHQFPEVQFNLGNALFQQQKYAEALKQFAGVSDARVAATLKAAAWYNAGNTHLQQKNYSAAIGSYKNVLRLNPRDEDARYNFTYASAMLAAQQGVTNKTTTRQPKEQLQPPLQDNLSPEELRRLLDELNASENQTLQRKPKQLQQKGKKERDW